jgi:hypothetical protein
MLTYPCYVHELKNPLPGLRKTSNQLFKSLVYALDQQEELRRLAGAPVQDRMPVFGAASAGDQVALYCAAYVEEEIVSLSNRPRCARYSTRSPCFSRITANRQLEATYTNRHPLARIRHDAIHHSCALLDRVGIRRQDQHLA